MILLMCAVRDAAVESFGRPFFVRAKGEALRSFQDEINRAAADNALYQHPADYDLYVIGEFDDASAVVTSSGVERIVRGVEVRNVSE